MPPKRDPKTNLLPSWTPRAQNNVGVVGEIFGRTLATYYYSYQHQSFIHSLGERSSWIHSFTRCREDKNNTRWQYN